MHLSNILKHPLKREGLVKFLLLLLVLAGYFTYLSLEYGLATGGLISALTWSFFVLCTPIADAGFLLDFPVRLITGMRMIWCECIVWGLAITINMSALTLTPETYQHTFLTSLLLKIITTPWPYWSIIILCAMGTFLSIKFGDEMMDALTHKECTYQHKHGFKYRLIALAAFILLIIWAYYHLIESLGVKVPEL